MLTNVIKCIPEGRPLMIFGPQAINKRSINPVNIEIRLPVDAPPVASEKKVSAIRRNACKSFRILRVDCRAHIHSVVPCAIGCLKGNVKINAPSHTSGSIRFENNVAFICRNEGTVLITRCIDRGWQGRRMHACIGRGCKNIPVR